MTHWRLRIGLSLSELGSEEIRLPDGESSLPLFMCVAREGMKIIIIMKIIPIGCLVRLKAVSFLTALFLLIDRTRNCMSQVQG